MENNLSIVKDKFKELPNNIEAEQSVIGSILVTNEIFDEISTIISSTNFYDPMHQKIYNAMESLIYKGMLANPITLKNYFEDEKDDLDVPEYLVKITKFSTSVRQAIEYSKIIYDMFVRRELIKISEQVNNKEYVFKKLSTENNELYGSVKPTEIAKLIQETNKIDIKPSMIQPVQEIKSLGKHKVKISLHSSVDAEITIDVQSAETIQ